MCALRGGSRPGVLEGLHEDHMGLVWHELEGEEWKVMSRGNTGPIREGMEAIVGIFFPQVNEKLNLRF